MVLLYRGNVGNLSLDVFEVQDRVNAKYGEILGEERAEKLKETLEKVLTSETFYQDAEEWQGITGQKLPEGKICQVAHQHSIYPSFDITEEGDFLARDVRISPLIYVNPDLAKNGAIAEYISVFNQAVFVASQSSPMYTAMQALTEAARVKHPARRVVDNVAQICSEETDAEIIKHRVTLASWAFLFNEAFILTVRSLNKLILESIGIPKEMPERGTERAYLELTPERHPNLKFFVPAKGDPFANLSDVQLVRQMISWEQYYIQRASVPVITRFLESLKNTTSKCVPFRELFSEEGMN